MPVASGSDLLPRERHVLIQQRLLDEGRVLAVDLAKLLKVSEDTIRRDLRDLAAVGLCRRVYGGALPISPQSGTLAERQTQHPARKADLARAAVSLVTPGSTVFIDAGSTTAAIAEALPERQGLTVATNSPAIAARLIGRADITVIVVGGRIDPKVGGAIGSKAIKDAEEIRSDLCFLGACGIDAEAGVTVFDYEDSEFKRSIAASSRGVVVTVTREKLATAASFVVAAPEDLHALVIESGADETQCQAFERLGVQVLRVAGERQEAA